MQLLIHLVIVAGGVFTDGLPQYQPPSSLQEHYKDPPRYSTVHDASSPIQDETPMYTYAEVNTPYYQYHYYSPVYKNPHNQPPLVEPSLPISTVRNEVISNAYEGSTAVKYMFYPASNNPLRYPEVDLRYNGYTPEYEPKSQPLSPTFHQPQEVPITSKSLTVNKASTMRTYQAPVSNEVYPPTATPISTPTELASGFPNIFRERNGNYRDNESSFSYKNTTLKPDLKFRDSVNSVPVLKSIVVPESLAIPSSTIIKDEVRRGISPQFVFRGQFSSPLKKPSLENSSLNTNTFTSTSPPQLNVPLHKSPEPSVSDSISATVLRVFSSPNLEITQHYTFNNSDVPYMETVLNNVPHDNVSKVSDSFISESSSQVSTQTPLETTVSHLQKIAKKVNPTVVSKQFLHKHPNVLFYSPGHDIPN